MKILHNLSGLEWKLAGFAPYHWLYNPPRDLESASAADVTVLPVQVPGSVQGALFQAGLLPDWNTGMNTRLYEWVENRHWIFQARIPDEWLTSYFQSDSGDSTLGVRLVCDGLDDRGWVWLNGQEVGRFENAFVPHTFDLKSTLRPSGNILWIIFDTPPRWLGQLGFTSQFTEWKPRFYYTWDWISRLVQIGIWDALRLELSDQDKIENLVCTSGWDPETTTGWLRLTGEVVGERENLLDVTLADAHGIVWQGDLRVEALKDGIHRASIPITPWWPNGMGSQPLYTLSVRLIDAQGRLLDEVNKEIGFKQIEWQSCEGAVPEADPWLCTVNGKPVFLQGFNWTPIRPNFADLREDDYRSRLELYRDLGVNILRVWGGAVLEKEVFYTLCDRLGILVWQEFPLSSSGLDNWPPEDAASIEALAATAESYIVRRQHHVSLLAWCGGNELQGDLKGNKTGVGKPVDASHPLIGRFARIVAEKDPGRRFMSTSSSGPRFYAAREDFGKGLHWDVHGPWKADPDLQAWQQYWHDVDALFHSEVGAPGASPAELIRRSKGEFPEIPGTLENPLWRRTSWWIEWPEFIHGNGCPPQDLEEYVDWSQNRQAEALAIVAGELKKKFPRCGGVIFWMGHDCFPCTANTSVIDFDGNPKPAALALKEVFHRPI